MSQPLLLTNIFHVSNHDAAYHIWHKAGVSNRTLVHIDAHPDFEWVGEASWLNIANFISLAIQQRMVREVYWVVPNPSWNHPRCRRNLITYIREVQARYPTPRAPLHIRRDEIALRLLDAAIHVCPLRSLPVFEQPILLDIDTDFLVTAWIPDADTTPPLAEPWCWPEQLAKRLRGLPVELVTIADSTEGGYTPLRWKYLSDELIDRLTRAGDEAALDVWNLMRNGTCALVAGRLAEAETSFRDVLARRPALPAAWFGLAETYAEQKRVEEARTSYQHAVDGDAAFGTHDLLANRYLTCGDVAQAARELDRIQILRPQTAQTWYTCSLLAAARGQWPEALVYAQRTIAQQSDFIPGHCALAQALEHLNRSTEALAAYEHALMLGLRGASSLDEGFIATHSSLLHRVGLEHVEIYRRLARLHAALDRIPEAITSYRMWLAGASDHRLEDYWTLMRLYAKHWWQQTQQFPLFGYSK